MDKIVYVCTGTCKAQITEAQYQNGLTQCGTDGCAHQGHQFEKRLECGTCGQLYQENESHRHG